MDKPLDRLRPVTNATTVGTSRVHTLVLSGMPSQFEPALAHAVWGTREGRRGAFSGIMDQYGRTDFRLSDALKRHTHPTRGFDRNTVIKSGDQVFNDVVVRIPRQQWIDGHRFYAGAWTWALIEQLGQWHTDEFGGALWKKRSPRYMVVPHSGPDDVVEFFWGRTVSLPGETEQPAGCIRLFHATENGHIRPLTLPTWPRYVGSSETLRLTQAPVAIYADQHCLLLGGARSIAPVVVDGWPFASATTAYIDFDNSFIGGEDGGVRCIPLEEGQDDSVLADLRSACPGAEQIWCFEAATNDGGRDPGDRLFVVRQPTAELVEDAEVATNVAQPTDEVPLADTVLDPVVAAAADLPSDEPVHPPLRVEETPPASPAKTAPSSRVGMRAVRCETEDIPLFLKRPLNAQPQPSRHRRGSWNLLTRLLKRDRNTPSRESTHEPLDAGFGKEASPTGPEFRAFPKGPMRAPRATVVGTPVQPTPHSAADAEPAAGRTEGGSVEVPCLRVTRLALLKVFGSKAADRDLNAWVLPVDRWGLPVAGANAADAPAPGVTRFAARRNDDRLYVRVPGATKWRVARFRDGFWQTPPDLGEPGTAIGLESVPAALADHAHAFLRLPEPQTIVLQQPCENGMLVGRDTGGGDGTEPGRLQLGLLSRVGQLMIDHASNATLEQLNLSRNHCRVVVQGRQLTVRMENGRAPVWRLDPALRVTGCLGVGDQEVLQLEPGESLLLGCYVVLFAVMPRP